MASIDKGAENNLFFLSGQEEKTIPYGWGGMPAFTQPDADAYRTITVRFRNEEDLREFATKIGHLNITPKTKAFWFPVRDKKANSLLRWFGDTSEE